MSNLPIPTVVELVNGAFEAVVGRLVYNVHERRLAVSAQLAGTVLDQLCKADNAVWPAAMAGPQIFEGGLTFGAVGGHGSGRVAYTVVEHTPGQRIMFRFDDIQGFDGQIIGVHYVEVTTDGADDGCMLRYVLHAEMRDELRGYWTKELGRMHDRAVGMLMDNFENAFQP